MRRERGELKQDVYKRQGVAMGNAEEGIKPLADFVSKRNDENGFAYALEKYVL